MKLGNVEQWYIFVWKKAIISFITVDPAFKKAIISFFRLNIDFTKAMKIIEFLDGKFAIKKVLYKCLK
jgi:hypothetical protein